MITKIYKVSAEWCGPCRQLKQELKDFDLVPIIEIDADEDEAFCEKYNIKNIPILLFVTKMIMSLIDKLDLSQRKI